ncbi:Uncharacterized protein SCF082_LOCUS34797, partial [Durusdinium trenchii]
MLTTLRQLAQDDAGFIVSAELVLISTIAVLGLIVGLSEVALNINNELEDVGSAFASIKQSYSYEGAQTQYAEDSRTNLSRPHRTAVALSSRDLYDRLTQIEVELQTAARTEGWNVSWSEHASAMGGARTAAREKRYARAVDELGRAIDALMTGVPRTADEGNNNQGAGSSGTAGQTN